MRRIFAVAVAALFIGSACALAEDASTAAAGTPGMQRRAEHRQARQERRAQMFNFSHKQKAEKKAQKDQQKAENQAFREQQKAEKDAQKAAVKAGAGK